MSDVTTSIRVLLVDDHALVRSGFRAILESEPDIAVVGEAANGEEAVAQAAALTPDVICMDVQMPGMDGLEATRQITSDAAGGAGVLVLTTFDRDDYLFAALEAGAAGFLLKNASPEKLVEAVRVVASGDALLAPDVTRRVIARATGTGARGDGGANGDTPEPDARLTELTEREREVLTLRDRVHAVVFAYENGVAIPGETPGDE